MVIDRLEVSYCEGWDPRAGRAAGPLSSSRAAERDRAGEQYALTLAMPGRPLAVIEVAWASAYCAVWFFDEQRRRVLQVDCRRLGGSRLDVVRGRQWAYTDAGQAEFDERVTRFEFEMFPDGSHSRAIFPGSAAPAARPRGLEAAGDMVVPEGNMLDAPAFGGWARLIGAFPGHLAALGHEMSPASVVEDVSDPGGDGLPAGARPWHPPRPRQPGPLALLFTPGTRLDVGSTAAAGRAGTVAVDVSQIAMLRMPSGALIACDPSYLRPVEPDASEWVTRSYSYQQSHQPFTATVPSGRYPVLLSRFGWLAGRGPIVAAAMVRVRDGRVASWQMALRQGEDPRTLPDNGFFGFGVDTATGCFFDAAAAPALAPLAGGLDRRGQLTAEVADEKSGANLIAFLTGQGDGAYPTWIGRTADGDIACFVADLLTFDAITIAR